MEGVPCKDHINGKMVKMVKYGKDGINSKMTGGDINTITDCIIEARNVL